MQNITPSAGDEQMDESGPALSVAPKGAAQYIVVALLRSGSPLNFD
jgi:hypothetical protein